MFLLNLCMVSGIFADANEELFAALKQYDPDKLQEALASGADVNALDDTGNPALNYAVFWPDLLEIMVNAKADVNNAGNLDLPPLLFAAQWGIPESMKLLIEAGANAKYRTKDGLTALHFATLQSNCAECVRLLLSAGADPNGKDPNGETPVTIMMTAISAKEHAETIHYSVEALKSVGFTALPPKLENPAPADFDEPGKVVEMLIKNGSDPNGANDNGTTPLLVAAYWNNTELMKFLMMFGADMNAKDNHGVTALMYAADHGNIEAVDALVSAGMDINENFVWYDGKTKANMKGFTILTMAAGNDDMDLLKYALDKGADCNVPSRGFFFSETTRCEGDVINKYPLYYAVENGNLEMVKSLAERCKPVSPGTWKSFEYKSIAKNCPGGGKYTTPSSYADKLGKADISAYLKTKGL